MTVPTIERLTPVDLINVHAETRSAPARLGAIAILGGRALRDGDGVLRIAEIRAELDRRLERVPRLRQIIRSAGPFGGRPVWIDDPVFCVDRHVLEAELPSGVVLTDLAMRLVNQPLARSHPLWRMWFVSGLPDGRVALVIGLHHVIADGVMTVRMIAALTDGADPGLPPRQPAERRRPTWAELVRDNWRRKVSALGAWHRPDLSQWREIRSLRDAPRTSLNAPVGARRRLAVVSMDLAEAKQIAHAHAATVNDVILAVSAGGLRQLLMARGERVDGVRLNATVAVSLRGDGGEDIGNRSGGIVVRVPLDGDPHRRLRAIAQDTMRAKRRQAYTTGTSLLVAMARVGVLRYFSRRQHMVNFVESDLTGPPRRLTLLGAPIVDITPVGTLVGNLTVGVVALSYAGRLTIAVQADADRCPDLDVLLDGVRQECRALLGERGPRSREESPWTLPPR